MQIFNDLRQHAKEKRDKIIAHARDEYVDTLTKSAALEMDILGRDPVKHRSTRRAPNR